MADADKPKVHSTFSALDAIETPDPYVYVTKAGKRVTFPDLYDLEFEEAEAFLTDIASGQSNSEVLRKWLSEKDYAALKGDRLTLRQITTLTQMVQSHYEGTVGTVGEGTASAR